jgi:hypothetical protein
MNTNNLGIIHEEMHENKEDNSDEERKIKNYEADKKKKVQLEKIAR